MGHTESADIIDRYLGFRGEIDKFVAHVSEQYPQDIACSPGCDACCRGGLTIVSLEGVMLGRALGIDAGRIHAIVDQDPLEPEGSCMLLGADHVCRAYEDRPLVCRTHGIPVLYTEAQALALCERNFPDQDPPPEDSVMDGEKMVTFLFLLNMEYCEQLGLSPLSRVAIDRIAGLARPDTL